MDEDDDVVPEIEVEIIDEGLMHLTRCTLLHRDCSCPEPSKKLICTCGVKKSDKCVNCYMLDDEVSNDAKRSSNSLVVNQE